MGSSLSGQLSMGSSLSELISSCKARIRTHVGAQKGKDSISIVDKITDAQLHEFHEAFSFFDKVCVQEQAAAVGFAVGGGTWSASVL